MHGLATKLLAVVATLMVALQAFGFAHVSFLCSMTGEVRESCCCAGQHAQPVREMQVKAQGCCHELRSEGHAVPSAVQEATPQVPPAALAQVLLALVAPPRRHVVPALERAPEKYPPGPPRFLACCSFLI
jgi:hypothetical protein